MADLNVRVRRIAVTGALSALVIALGITGLGFIRLPGLALTIVHTPVIIGAILEGPLAGACIGLLFGIFSMVQAAITGGAEGAAFVNPFIAVLPRLFIGPAAWLVYGAIASRRAALADAPASPLRETIAIAVSAFIGSFTNTALVLFMLFVFNYFPLNAVILIAVTNGLPEAVLAIILITAVVSAWKRLPRGSKSKLAKELSKSGILSENDKPA